MRVFAMVLNGTWIVGAISVFLSGGIKNLFELFVQVFIVLTMGINLWLIAKAK